MHFPAKIVAHVVGNPYLYGMKQQTNSTLGFADLVAGRRKVKAEFFNQITRVIDWAPEKRIIETVYTKGRGPL